MNDSSKNPDDIVVESRFSKHKLFFLIVTSVVLALLLVMVSMALYASSGAAQLDLSRPGYKAVQDKIGQSSTFESFPATGPVNDQVLDQFIKLYDRQIQPVLGDSPFNPESLSDHALGLVDKTTN